MIERTGPWLVPPLLLAVALSSLFFVAIDKTHFNHGGSLGSAETLSLAEHLSVENRLRMCLRLDLAPDGAGQCLTYGRRPVGIHVLVKLVMLPVDGDLLAMVAAVRTFMMLLLCAGAVLAYLALRRVAANSWVALGATLLAFSSHHVLHYGHAANAEISNEVFAVMLVFHGMVIYAQDGRFGQLVAKTCVAVLLGWHVYALLLPFIVLGLVDESVRAVRGQRAARDQARLAYKRAAVALVRSRFVALGLIALLFGTAVLGFNLANEYAAHDRELSPTELPTSISLLNKASFWNFEIDRQGRPPFPLQQLHRVGAAVVPFAFPAPRDYAGRLAQRGWVGIVVIGIGVFALVACPVWLLSAGIARREKLLLGALALFSPCWALAVWRNTYGHPLEAIFWLGLALTLHTLVLLRYGRRLGGRLAAWVAIAAMPVFALSALKEGRHSRSDDRQKAMMGDFNAIRETTRGKTVFLARDVYTSKSWPAKAAGFFLPDSILQFDTHAPFTTGDIAYDGFKNRKRAYDFIVSTRRFEHLAPLTPNNQRVFLYDGRPFATADAFFAESYRLEAAPLAATKPDAIGDYQLYLQENKLTYFKAPCAAEDKRGIFFLHIVPRQPDDLPEHRRKFEFDNYDFSFADRGTPFDDKCLANVQLPGYAIGIISTGQYLLGKEGVLWRVDLDVAAVVAAGEPDARSDYRVYLQGRKLTYLKTPCADEDTRGLFFLHVVAEQPNDLSKQRREAGFDNLDFRFQDLGTRTDYKCIVSVQLPSYDIAAIATGQYAPDGEDMRWRVELDVGGR